MRKRVNYFLGDEIVLKVYRVMIIMKMDLEFVRLEEDKRLLLI